MKGKQLRAFLVDGREMVFHTERFHELFTKHAANQGMRIGHYEAEMSEALFVDQSAIHNWRLGVNGPGDMEKIRMIADLWHIKYENLLLEVETVNTPMNVKTLTDSEKVALKNVYVAFLSYMDAFESTSGFIWNKDGSDYDINMAYALYYNAKRVLELEYIDLKATVFDDLMEFYGKDLTWTLEGYFDPEEGDHPESMRADAEELRSNLEIRFKEIIDPYLR